MCSDINNEQKEKAISLSDKTVYTINQEINVRRIAKSCNHPSPYTIQDIPVLIS